MCGCSAPIIETGFHSSSAPPTDTIYKKREEGQRNSQKPLMWGWEFNIGIERRCKTNTYTTSREMTIAQLHCGLQLVPSAHCCFIVKLTMDASQRQCVCVFFFLSVCLIAFPSGIMSRYVKAGLQKSSVTRWLHHGRGWQAAGGRGRGGERRKRGRGM